MRTFVAAVALMSATACSAANERSGGNGDDIVIGAAIARSGFMTAYDEPAIEGFKVLMDEVNEAGGIDGRQLVLVEEDTSSTTEGAQAAAQQLVSEGVDIMLVTANFDFGAPAGTVAQNEGMLNISLGASSDLYGPIGIGPQAYTPNAWTYLEGHVMVQTLADLGLAKPFVLTDDSIDYGTQVGQGVVERLDQLTMTAAGSATFKNGDTSLSNQVSDIKASGADSIALSSYLPGGATALRQIRAAGITVPIVAPGGGMTGTDWTEAVPDLNDFYVGTPASLFGDDPDPAIQEFVAKYSDATGEAPTMLHSILGYNVGELIVEALEGTDGDTDGPKLSEVLDGLTDFRLLGGAITYTPEQHIKTDGPVSVIKFTNGEPAYFTTIDDAGPVEIGN